MLAKLQFIQLHREEQPIPGMKQNYLILRPISLLQLSETEVHPTGSWYGNTL